MKIQKYRDLYSANKESTQKEKNLLHTIELAQIGIYEFDYDNGIFLNEYLWNLLDLDSGQRNVWVEQCVCFLEKKCQNLAERKQEEFSEEFYLHFDTKQLYLQVSGHILAHDAQGNIQKISGTIAKKCTQEQKDEIIQEEEKRLQEMLTRINVGLWKWDYEQEVIYINDSTRKIVHYSPSLTPKEVFENWRANIASDDVEGLFDKVQKLLAGKIDFFINEYRLLCGDGKWRWMEVYGAIHGADREKSIINGTISDVSDRKNAEMRIIEEKKRSQYIIEAANVATWDGFIQEDTWIVNDRFIEMLGFSRKELKLPPRKFWNSRIRKEQKANVEKIFGQFISGAVSKYECFYQLKHKKGHWVWVACYGQITEWFADGRVKRVSGINQDITWQKNAEQELAQYMSYERNLALCSQQLLCAGAAPIEKSLEYLCSIARADRAVIVEFKHDDRGQLYVQCLQELKQKSDSRLLSISGKPYEEWVLEMYSGKIISGSVESVSSVQRRFLQKCGLQSMLCIPIVQHTQWQGAIIFERDSQRVLSSETEIQFLQRGSEIIGSFLCRQVVEDALVCNEKRLYSIMDDGMRGLWESDLDGTFTYFSKKTGELLGYANADIEDLKVYDIVVPEERAALKESIQQCTKSTTSRNIVIGKNGKRKCYATTICPTRNKNGVHSGYRGVYTDITREIKHEREIYEAQKKLTLSSLSGGIAHDFNNNLMGMIGFSDILLDMMDEEGKKKQYVKNINFLARTSADIIKELLTFAKRAQIAFKPIEVQTIFQSALCLADSSLDNQISFENEMLEEEIFILGGVSLLQNAFLNLVINGRDAMGGEGTLKIRTEKCFLDEDFCENSTFNLISGEYVHISIQDTGSGMDKKTQSKIFIPYFTTKGDKGTGLGMATTHSTIVQHNGAILIDSELGKGTTFHIYLPIYKGALLKEEKLEEKSYSMPVKKKRILFAEDENIVRSLVQEFLRQAGHEVLVYDNALETFETYKKEHESIDVVVSDMFLPEMSGWEMYSKMKAINKDIIMILVSGYTNVEKVEEMLEGGIADFIQKPFDKKTLVQAIEKVTS